MRLRNGADEYPDTVEPVMDLLKTMSVKARKEALKVARGRNGPMSVLREAGLILGNRMSPRTANIVKCAVRKDGTLQSPYDPEVRR